MSLKNPVTPPVIDSETVQLVAQHLNYYAIQGPTKIKYQFKISTKSPDLAHLTFHVLKCESLHVRTFKCMLLRDIQYNLMTILK